MISGRPAVRSAGTGVNSEFPEVPAAHDMLFLRHPHVGKDDDEVIEPCPPDRRGLLGGQPRGRIHAPDFGAQRVRQRLRD